MRYDISKTVFFFAVLILCLHFDNSFAYGATSRVSVGSSGERGNFDSFSNSISANGRYVAFESRASNLVEGDTNRALDIFVRDRLTKQTTRVSVDSNGIQSNTGAGSLASSISADGRYVTFSSYATNLVIPPFGTTDERIYVHDRSTKQTTLVSETSDFVPSTISGDGRYVAFYSVSSTIVPGDTNNVGDIFVYDRQSKQTTRVSVSSSGQQGNSWSNDISPPSLSADGRYVVFESLANNLVPGDTNFSYDVFVHDRLTHQTTRVNIDSNGIQANDSSFGAVISADGRFIAFNSIANNLVAGDINNVGDVYIHDRLNHQTSLVSLNFNGVAGGGHVNSISPDGRYVAFASDFDLVAGDTNGVVDVYVRDRLKQTTARVSVGFDRQQQRPPGFAVSMSADGRYVSFGRSVSFNGNPDYSDVFVRDLKLDTSHQADLQVTVNQKPATLARDSQGSYSYNISNHGPDDIGILRVTHLVSNGQVIGFTPSQGTCNRYATISLCELGLLPVGGTITLKIDIKANELPLLNQQISISSNGRADPIPGNNYLTVNTPVTLP